MKHLLLCFSFFLSLNVLAQTEHFISWRIGATGTDLTIDVGDTVIWTWDDTAPHTVTSLPGATEPFNSGGPVSNSSFQFSFTFNQEGVNPYQCNVHPSMAGTITVQNTLNVGKQGLDGFEIRPNPARSSLNVYLPAALGNATKLEVYDVLGKRMLTAELQDERNNINIGSWHKGVYLVRLTSDEKTATKRFIKN